MSAVTTPSGYAARMLAHSVSPTGVELSTIELTLPRIVLAELNTHRVLSKNSASSRAIPTVKQIKMILEHPFVPERFGLDEPGMQSSSWAEADVHEAGVESWLQDRDQAVYGALQKVLGFDVTADLLGSRGDVAESGILRAAEGAERVAAALEEAQRYVRECRAEGRPQERYLSLHKQLVNRPLEPFMWHKVLLSGTEWGNFLALRTGEGAQAEIRTAALLVEEALRSSTPRALAYGEWHLPLLTTEELSEVTADTLLSWVMVSVGRCARVSYLTHDGRRDPVADERLADRLLQDGHMSPWEHVATPLAPVGGVEVWSGNFRGFFQLRKGISAEEDFGKVGAGRRVVTLDVPGFPGRSAHAVV